MTVSDEVGRQKSVTDGRVKVTVCCFVTVVQSRG